MWCASSLLSLLISVKQNDRSIDDVFLAPGPRSHEAVALWHLDVEGAEVPALQSAARLLASGRIERVLIEVMPEHWAKYQIRPAAGLQHAKRAFAGWRCVVTCRRGRGRRRRRRGRRRRG